MKIPISAIAFDKDLLINRNSCSERVPFPFKPFILAEKSQFKEYDGVPEVILTKVPENLSTPYFKLEFRNNEELYNYKQNHKDKINYISADKYIEQVFIHQEDFFLSYPHTNSLKIMFYDIEVATNGTGLFPKPISIPVICIGYSVWEINDKEKKLIERKVIKSFDRTTLSDKQILNDFLNDIKHYNPDILCDFNGRSFDFPYMFHRCELNQINTSGFGRSDRPPQILDEEIRIPGRIHFDLYASNAGVIKDQVLFGLKNRGLKEIARFYKAPIKDVEVKEHIENLLKLYDDNKELLYQYQEEDIIRTEHVGFVYLRNCITLAEIMKVPLSYITGMNSSFVPKMLLARNYKKLGLINTRTNHFKYNKTNGVIAKLGQKFQGALVGLYKDGLYDNLYKADFSSMYPSSIQTFNLGPDTTTLVSVEEYTGKYNCIIKENYNWYRIPTMFDKGEYAYDLIVKIRNDKNGFLKKDITELKAERKKIRKEMETCKPEEKETLNSQQTAIKIILNSIYGVLSDDTSTYGDIICGLTITSMCRWITTQTMRKIGDCVVNVDTDGMIVTKEIKLEELNPWLDKIIKEKFNITDNYMQLGLEEFGRGFFIAMKTYILQEGNKYIRHGSSILSSRSCKIVDKAIDLAIQHVFNNKPIEEVILEAYDFSKCTIDDFTERVKLSMEQSEYNDQNCWQNFLAIQAQDKTGQVITADTQLTYLVTKDQLKDKKYRKYYKGQWNYTFYKNVNDIKELNFIYYKELVAKALKKFDIEGIKQLSLDLGFGERIAKELDIFPSGEVL